MADKSDLIVLHKETSLKVDSEEDMVEDKAEQEDPPEVQMST